MIFVKIDFDLYYKGFCYFLQGYNQAVPMAHCFALGHTVFVKSVPNWHIDKKCDFYLNIETLQIKQHIFCLIFFSRDYKQSRTIILPRGKKKIVCLSVCAPFWTFHDGITLERIELEGNLLLMQDCSWPETDMIVGQLFQLKQPI